LRGGADGLVHGTGRYLHYGNPHLPAVGQVVVRGAVADEAYVAEGRELRSQGLSQACVLAVVVAARDVAFRRERGFYAFGRFRRPARVGRPRIFVRQFVFQRFDRRRQQRDFPFEMKLGERPEDGIADLRTLGQSLAHRFRQLADALLCGPYENLLVLVAVKAPGGFLADDADVAGAPVFHVAGGDVATFDQRGRHAAHFFLRRAHLPRAREVVARQVLAADVDDGQLGAGDGHPPDPRDVRVVQLEIPRERERVVLLRGLPTRRDGRFRDRQGAAYGVLRAGAGLFQPLLPRFFLLLKAQRLFLEVRHAPILPGAASGRKKPGVSARPVRVRPA